uniref:Uncharacterized protein n=1 Tax=viral metagenome TaxID=1070528 RepID=A0A6C0AV12_9ZZZZ
MIDYKNTSNISDVSQKEDIDDSEHIYKIVTVSFVITSTIGILMCHVFNMYKQRDKVLPM